MVLRLKTEAVMEEEEEEEEDATGVKAEIPLMYGVEENVSRATPLLLTIRKSTKN